MSMHMIFASNKSKLINQNSKIEQINKEKKEIINFTCIIIS